MRLFQAGEFGVDQPGNRFKRFPLMGDRQGRVRSPTVREGLLSLALEMKK
jgi:hypothetical protein